METICIECQSLFSGKNKKNTINVSSAEWAQRVAKIKPKFCIQVLISYYVWTRFPTNPSYFEQKCIREWAVFLRWTTQGHDWEVKK